MEQLVRSNIHSLEFKDKFFSFIMDTEVIFTQEPETLRRERNLVSLSSNPESFKNQLILNPINVANEMRIALMNEVETIAIDSVDIISNTSFLEDELLEIRLNLIPIQITDNELIWDIWSSEEYNITGELNVTAEADGFKVTSEMIEFEDERIKCTPRLEIITLAKNQRLRFSVKANKGIGSIEKKYSPVSTIGYEIINDHSVKLTPNTKNKIPQLFILLYALQVLESNVENFEYTIEGDKTLARNEFDEVIIE
jgi:hypothetical protein